MSNSVTFPVNHMGAPSKYEIKLKEAIKKGSDVIELSSRMRAQSCCQYLKAHGYHARQSNCLVQFSKEPFEDKKSA